MNDTTFTKYCVMASQSIKSNFNNLNYVHCKMFALFKLIINRKRVMKKGNCFNYMVLIFTFLSSCHQNKHKALPAVSSRYDFENPIVITLPAGLAEISGVVFYPKDSSVFAIVDEDGLLFKIGLNKENKIEKWRFDKKRDYEDIVLHDSMFYVLVSNGDIETIQFENGDSIVTTLSAFPDASKKTNEFESLYYDDTLKQMILLCKNCEDDGSKMVTAWSYDIVSKNYIQSIYNIDANTIAQKLKEDKIKLRASATAINPITNELYILSSINHIILVTDRQGKYKALYKLDPATYKQAEGIAFTPWGDMIVSNESKNIGSSNILIIKNKQK